MLALVFERFARKNPVSVMAMAIAERTPNPERLDEWFDRTGRRQYTETLLFSTVFELAGKLDDLSRRIQSLRWKTRISTGYDPSSVGIPRRFAEVVNWKGRIDAEYMENLRLRYAERIVRLANGSEVSKNSLLE